MHNALGYAYFSMEKSDMAIKEYQQAVEKQPGYALRGPLSTRGYSLSSRYIGACFRHQ